ncbi:MAG: hypothetical protein GY816_11005 [Cytophagales bacterium]|nr:hypothetical protein [Cytophagales bacterium]
MKLKMDALGIKRRKENKLVAGHEKTSWFHYRELQFYVELFGRDVINIYNIQAILESKMEPAFTRVFEELAAKRNTYEKAGDQLGAKTIKGVGNQVHKVF